LDKVEADNPKIPPLKHLCKKEIDYRKTWDENQAKLRQQELFRVIYLYIFNFNELF